MYNESWLSSFLNSWGVKLLNLNKTLSVFNADSDTGGYTWEMENIMKMLPSSRKPNRCYYLTDTILTWSSMTSFYIASMIICPCWSLTPNNVAHILIYVDVNLCLRDYLIWHRNMRFTYQDKLLIESSILHNDQDLIKEKNPFRYT